MELGQAYGEVLPASHRKALAEGAIFLIDTTFGELGGSNLLNWSPDNWTIGSMLPERYTLKYTPLFAKKFFTCFLMVVWKLSQREPIQLSCVAEELAAHILIQEAESVLEEAGLEADFGGFEDCLFEDLDFEFLYDDAKDGIDETDIGETLGMTNLAFGDWFKRFGSPSNPDYFQVHLYARGANHEDDSEPA